MIVNLTKAQAEAISEALDSWTYEQAPDDMRNNGYALDPRKIADARGRFLDPHDMEDDLHEHCQRLDMAKEICALLKNALDSVQQNEDTGRKELHP